MLIHRLCLLACLVVPSALAQTAPPMQIQSSAVFRASLVRLRKEQLAEWRRSLQQVEIEQLPIGYANGKLIEKTRDQALQWLGICDVAADHALQHDSLVEDILFASNMSELFHSMQDVSTILDNTELPNGLAEDLKNKWSKRIQDLASGPIYDLSQSSLNFSVARAVTQEKECHR
jgi:hypothetical protein